LLIIINGWGEPGKVIVRVSIDLAVFSGAVEKKFRAKMAQPPLAVAVLGKIFGGLAPHHLGGATTAK